MISPALMRQITSSAKEDDMRTVYETMFRHLHSELARVRHTEDTVEAFRDPTTRNEWTGYVTFTYDPWEPLDETEQGLHPVMGTTYSVRVTEVFGIYSFDLRLIADAEKVRDDYVTRGWKVAPERETWDMTWDQLDRLLSGQFHAEQPSLTWLGDLYAVEPDFPVNR